MRRNGLNLSSSDLLCQRKHESEIARHTYIYTIYIRAELRTVFGGKKDVKDKLINITQYLSSHRGVI